MGWEAGALCRLLLPRPHPWSSPLALQSPVLPAASQPTASAPVLLLELPSLGSVIQSLTNHLCWPGASNSRTGRLLGKLEQLVTPPMASSLPNSMMPLSP